MEPTQEAPDQKSTLTVSSGPEEEKWKRDIMAHSGGTLQTIPITERELSPSSTNHLVFDKTFS